MMPNDLPPWYTVYQQAQRWINAGVFEDMVHDLRALMRLAKGRKEHPTAAIFDSRALQSTPESGARAGYDGHKRRKGSKPHIAIGYLGAFAGSLYVTPAGAQDRAQDAAPFDFAVDKESMYVPSSSAAGIDFSQKKADCCLMFPNGRLLERHRAFDDSRSCYSVAKQLLLEALDRYGFDGVDVSGEATHHYRLPFFLQLAAEPQLAAYALQLFLLNPRWVRWFSDKI